MPVKGGSAGFEQEQELGWQMGTLRLRKMEEEGSVTGRVGEYSMLQMKPECEVCHLSLVTSLYFSFLPRNRPLQCPAV